MSAAKTTAAHWGAWRRSAVTLLAACAGASMVLGGSAGGVFATDPNPTSTPAPGHHSNHGNSGNQGTSSPAANTTPAPSASPVPSASPAPKPAPKASPDASLTPAQQRVENVIAAAKQYLGVAYRVGTEGPSLFDCSGLVFRAFTDAGLADRIGNMRLRAAGYMRWFAARSQMTADVTQAQRGDLVVYNNGSHIGIYLGDGRVISALLTGVTVHSLNGVSLPVTGFLRPDWSGDGKVPPFVPVTVVPPDVPETPATLIPALDWMPTVDTKVSAPAQRDGTERADLRTVNSRTFQNADGTFTTEFHAQPIFYQPAGTTDPADLQPIDLTFQPLKKTGYSSVTTSPVAVTARPATDKSGLLTAAAGSYAISLGLATSAGMAASTASPTTIDGGRVMDYFDLQPGGLGMRVLAQTDGFKSFLVLSKSPDKTRISFTIDAPGLTPALMDDGSVIFTDASGATAGRIPNPLLLDSSDSDGNGGGIFSGAASLALDTTGKLPVLSVILTKSKLDEAVFPAYVDLSLTDFPAQTAGADASFVSSFRPNTNLHGFQRPESPGFDELWLGHQPSTHTDNEVFLRFPGLAQVLGTVDVASATLELLPYFQRSNDGVTIVRRVTADWNVDALTWATRPATTDDNSVKVTSEAGSWSSLDVSSYVTDVLSRGVPDYGLELAGDDTTTGTWKRLAASDTGATGEFGPRLVVTWSGLRPTTTIVPVTDPAALVVGTATPTLTWSQPQLAVQQVRFQVQASRDGFATTLVDSGPVKGSAGHEMQWAVPAAAITSNGTYSWRVRVRYGTDKAWSSWSTPQSFVVTTVFAPPHSAI